jgi:hypothetical protein
LHESNKSSTPGDWRAQLDLRRARTGLDALVNARLDHAQRVLVYLDADPGPDES